MNELKQDSDSHDFWDISWNLKINEKESKDFYETTNLQTNQEESEDNNIVDEKKKRGPKKQQKKTNKSVNQESEAQTFANSNFVYHDGKNWSIKNRGGEIMIACEQHRNPVQYCICKNSYDPEEFMVCCDNCGKLNE